MVMSITNPLVIERFSDGMALAKSAFAANTNYTDIIKAFAYQLASESHPLTNIALLKPPTYAELDALFNFTVPIAPTSPDFPPLPALDIPAPNTQFSYNESNYISPVDTVLSAKIAAKIAAGGTGLGATIETGIWNREQERALLERMDAIARMEDDAAAGGFSLPDGVVAMMLIDQETKYKDSRLTSNRDIATKQAELAYEQQTKIFEVGNTYEGTHTNYATAMRNRLLEAAKAGPQIAVDIFRAAVERVNVYIAQYNAIATKANAQAEVFKAQIMAYTAGVDTRAKIIGSSVQKYSSDVEGVFRANESEIAKDQLLVQQLLAFLNLQLESMKAVSQVNAQIAASALTGMSASASLGAAESQSYTISDNTSVSTSTSTTHSYDETKAIPEG